jgi:uncharacterized protein (TIGR02145 family)
VFFPAAGYRRASNGIVDGQGSRGYYWSSTTNGTSDGYYLGFNDSSATPSNYLSYTNCFSVRCVRDAATTDFTPCPAGEYQIGSIV